MATMHLSVYSYKKIVLSQRKPRDAEAILFGLKFANDIHYKLRCSQASIKQGFIASNIDCDLNATYIKYVTRHVPYPCFKGNFTVFP